MPDSKVTSKGQVTVPVEVRRALGIEDGDLLAFEVVADYAVVTRRPGAREVSEAARARTEGRRAALTDDEAVGSAFDNERMDENARPMLVTFPKRPVR